VFYIEMTQSVTQRDRPQMVKVESLGIPRKNPEWFSEEIT